MSISATSPWASEKWAGSTSTPTEQSVGTPPRSSRWRNWPGAEQRGRRSAGGWQRRTHARERHHRDRSSSAERRFSRAVGPALLDARQSRSSFVVLQRDDCGLVAVFPLFLAGGPGRSGGLT